MAAVVAYPKINPFTILAMSNGGAPEATLLAKEKYW